MKDEAQYVECCEHGKQHATYVCQHVVQSLVENIPNGFWWSTENPKNPKNPRPDAWCTECEELVSRVGEWINETEEFAGVKLLCGACYDRAKEMNVKTKKY